MSRTILRQETQIRNSDAYDGSLAAGQATLETAASNIEYDLNALRSQVKRILNSAGGAWYDDIPTVNSKQRDLTDLNTDLDDLEEKRILCPVVKTVDLTVPANTYASGSIVAVAKANIIDSETFTISDGRNTAVIFEFDTVPDGVSGGNVAVDISAATTDVEVATAMVSAINGVGTTLELTASNVGGTSATVTITHDVGGTHGNVTTWADTVANAGFVVTQPTGGAGDVVVLSQSSGETPTEAAAVNAGTALGALVATLSGDVGSHSLAEISATHPSIPKNRLLIRDAQLHEGITDAEGRQVYGLLQAESGVVDGNTFNDTDKQVQISFVVISEGTPDDLVPAAGEAIGGKTIEYIYAARKTLDTLPEDCTFPFFPFTDASASVSVTLNNALDNQGTTPATQNTTIRIDQDADVEFQWRDALGAELFSIHEGSTGGTSAIDIYPGVDIFNVDAVTTDFANEIKVDTGGTTINIGVTAGQIDSAGALAVKSGGAADLTLQAANEILFVDTNKGGSTYSGSFKLADTSGEWDAFESAMEAVLGSGNGEVSLLKAITVAAQNRRKDKVYSVATTNVNADTDVGGPSTANNLDADLPDFTAGTFLTDYDVFLNGGLLRPGADAAANNDYYPGTAAAELKFEFKIKADDVICVQPYS